MCHADSQREVPDSEGKPVSRLVSIYEGGSIFDGKQRRQGTGLSLLDERAWRRAIILGSPLSLPSTEPAAAGVNPSVEYRPMAS